MTTSAPPTQPSSSIRLLRVWTAAIAGLLVFFAANALGVWWLRGSQFSSNAFYDGWAAGLTLALPAFLGGLCVGFVAPERRIVVALLAFAWVALRAFIRPLWQIPLVSPQSVHSGAMHYFLRSPLCLLSFALLGAWLAEQFALGRFTLADKTPVSPAQMGDD